MTPRDALQIAQSRELDLVEIAPNATPPVCKIVDYGKHRYEQQKREKVQRKSQHQQQLKEVRLHPRTDTHDLEFKQRHAREWLEEGNKVKFSVLFKGREMAHKDIGRELLEGIITALADCSRVDQEVRMDGRNMHMTLTPDGKKRPVPAKPKAPGETKAGSADAAEPPSAALGEALAKALADSPDDASAADAPSPDATEPTPPAADTSTTTTAPDADEQS